MKKPNKKARTVKSKRAYTLIGTQVKGKAPKRFRTRRSAKKVFAVRTALKEGIDVSHFNHVDWPNLDPTIQFAILKATDGSNFTDPNYVLNMTVARQTALKLG